MFYKVRHYHTWRVALPGCDTASKIRGTAAAPWNSIGHLTENVITFYSELRLRDLGLFKKLVSRAIQPSREQAPRSISAGAVLSVFSHVSTWVRLVWALEICLRFVLHPLDSTAYLYSRSREYNHFNHLSLQCLHMLFLLNIASWGVAINFVSSLWPNIPWACDLNHFNTCEFNLWLQVTFTNDLILKTIWLLIAWLVPRLNASTLFFTLAMVPQSSSHRLPFTSA
jgi:hypothetical protein